MKARALEHRLEAACAQADRTIESMLDELEDEFREVEFTARVDAMKNRRHHQQEDSMR